MVTAHWAHTSNFKVNTAGAIPDLLTLQGIDPNLPKRKIFISADQSSGNFDITGVLRCFYQGKLTFSMPLSLQSGAALATTRLYTGGVLAPARDSATFDDDTLSFQHRDLTCGALRNLAPIAAFVTCDTITFETLIVNQSTNTGSAFMRLLLGCYSEMANV